MATTPTITWRGGRDILTIEKDLQQRKKEIKANALIALELTIEEGAVDTQDGLEAATTPTGERRAARGGFPGRHDSGNMVGSLSYEIRNAAAQLVTGVFGWWGENFEKYFSDQDLGEGNIPAARALPTAFDRAIQKFRARMLDVTKGKIPS